MNREGKRKAVENSDRQAVEMVKALSHLNYPEEVSRVGEWLEMTRPLLGLVRRLCEGDGTGRVLVDCVKAVFEVVGSRREDVSPAVWEILQMVEEEDIKYLIKPFLREATPRLIRGFRAFLCGVCQCGARLPKLQVWCHTLIEALEEEKKFNVLVSVSESVALKLLQGILLPHKRKIVFSLFERLLYPMPNPKMFYSVVDKLPEVLLALDNDEMSERFRGLIKILLHRFPQTTEKEETYRKLKTELGKHPQGEHKLEWTVWNHPSKTSSKLFSILECPVCYERFVTPITACENGHCICSNCRDQLKTCPICRGQISNVRMTIMDQIMEMTTFECKNLDAGCEVKLPYKDIWNHELSCEYRTVSCDLISSHSPPKLFCNEDVVVAHFHKHIEKCHRGFVTEFRLSDKRTGELRRQKANEVRLLRTSDATLYFIERIYVTEEEIFFSYHYIGKSEDANNYVYTLKIVGVPQEIRYTNFCLPNYMGVVDTEVDERCLILEPEKIFYAQQKFKYSVKIEEANVYRMRSRKNKFLVSN